MLLDFFGTKFLKHKFDALDGKVTVCFQEQSEPPLVEPFRILCTKEGMTFKGELSKVISTRAELEDFARLIGEAWGEHTKLAPKLVTTLSGH